MEEVTIEFDQISARSTLEFDCGDHKVLIIKKIKDMFLGIDYRDLTHMFCMLEYNIPMLDWEWEIEEIPFEDLWFYTKHTPNSIPMEDYRIIINEYINFKQHLV